MKIATFNINNINRRLPNLLAWLAEARADVVCLQELKATDRQFPRTAIAEAGYGAAFVGQSAWNGVAILARGTEPVVTQTQPARRRGRRAGALHRGGGQRRDHRLALCAQRQSAARSEVRLQARLDGAAACPCGRSCLDSKLPIVLAGDYNIVPEPRDIYVTTSYRDNALVQPAPRAAYQALLAQGWTDALRKLHPDDPALYTFWDYMRNRWPRNAGMRLDHLLLSRKVARRLRAAGVDREVRGETGASDHAPVWIDLKPE